LAILSFACPAIFQSGIGHLVPVSSTRSALATIVKIHNNKKHNFFMASLPEIKI
jgi:hypothetical protein